MWEPACFKGDTGLKILFFCKTPLKYIHPIPIIITEDRVSPWRVRKRSLLHKGKKLLLFQRNTLI